MYSAEPLPHFVDEYLSYLYEVHPTNATFDGVHLHDDLLEDWSRQAIDGADPRSRRFARRLAAIDPARLTDTERLERPALDAQHPRAAVRARRGPALGAQPAALRRRPGDEPGRPGALRLRAARRAGPPRAVEAAPGAAVHPGGARQHQGSARHLRQGRPREHARHAALHRRGSAARVRRSRRPAPARRSRRRVDRGGRRDRRLHRLSRARSRAAQQGLVPARPRSVRAEVPARRRHHARRRSAARDRDPRAAQRRRRSSAASRHASTAAIRSRPGRRRRTITRRPASSSRSRSSSSPSWSTSSTGSGSSRSRKGAPVEVAPTPRFYRWTFASMWTPGPFEARPLRAFYYITDVEPSWPPERQDEHLRDFNYGALWSISIHEVFPGPLPALPAPAPGRRRSCASRSSSRRPRSSKAGRTTASR